MKPGVIPSVVGRQGCGRSRIDHDGSLVTTRPAMAAGVRAGHVTHELGQRRASPDQCAAPITTHGK